MNGLAKGSNLVIMPMMLSDLGRFASFLELGALASIAYL